MQQPGSTVSNDVATRIALRTLAARGTDYSDEVRRLLDAGREVMRQNGTTAKARVADIVTAAGLSNDAFYRHFASKEALVAAILEDGAERLASYLHHQMEKETTPEGKVRRWIEGVLSQAADDEIATATLAVLWNAGNDANRLNDPSTSARLAPLLHEPLRQLGSTDAELDALLAAYAIIGKLNDYLWQRTRPTPAETEGMLAFCVSAVKNNAPMAPEPSDG